MKQLLLVKMSSLGDVVHAYSGFEKNVARALAERVELSTLGQYFGEILVPTEEVVEMRAGQKRRSERKFFPGYVLVHMELNDDTWHLVKETPRVMVRYKPYSVKKHVKPLSKPYERLKRSRQHSSRNSRNTLWMHLPFPINHLLSPN